jgi:hypothetical protein
MRAWVDEFTKQIQEIEEFFKEKFEEKIALFIEMQAKYLTKLQREEVQAEDSEEEQSTKNSQIIQNVAFVNPIDGKRINMKSPLTKKKELENSKILNISETVSNTEVYKEG